MTTLDKLRQAVLELEFRSRETAQELIEDALKDLYAAKREDAPLTNFGGQGR